VARVQRYYATTESRLGYRLVLGGTKHFGWYEDGESMWRFARSMRRMEDELGRRLDLAPGSAVLDAGCGVGDVARHLARAFGLSVVGVDVLDFNLATARRRSAEQGLAGSTDFRFGDFHHLALADGELDGAYSMETVVHSPSPRDVVAELFRVLRPGGHLVMVEYSRTPPAQVGAAATHALEAVCDLASMPGWLLLEHGALRRILVEAGFESVLEDDVTARMLPMLRAFSLLGRVPYALGRAVGKPAKVVNAMSGVEMYRHRDAWRYTICSARKPS